MTLLGDRREVQRAIELSGSFLTSGTPPRAPRATLSALESLTAILNHSTEKRTLSFERDYPALLLSLASGVRTGLDPLAALCKTKELFAEDSEMKQQLEGLGRSIERGDSEEDAIRSFASDIPHPDLKLFRTAFILARKEGASLAECLQRLARVTRQRQSFRRKVKAAVAMQKLSAVGIGICTLVIAAIQASTNPAALQTALHDPVGSKVLMAAVLLVATGLAWMLLLTRSRL